MVLDIAKACRSYRRFDEGRKISEDTLRALIECARYAPSSANMQRLRFLPISDSERCDAVFSTLKFAGYLKDWDGPAKGERPVAYVVICSESELDTHLAIDLGICAESIALAAAEQGIGCCMFRSYSVDKISDVVAKDGMKPHLVMAFGYPAEIVAVEDMTDGNVKYYRDALDRHIVPKRTLDELII